MKLRLLKFVTVLAALSLMLAACGPANLTSTTRPEPYKITGSFSFTNGIVFERYFTENAVALVDMHGFVVRDQYWELPLDSQVLGYMNVDLTKQSGTFELNLPERPEGVLNDVDNNGKKDAGVQIFTISYFPNLAGGPFSEGDDKSFGWPNYLASVKTDATNQYEVTGGQLVIWAPDDNQSFPSSFGKDGKLFTADDPEAKISSGWTIVNLDTSPFTFSRDTEPKMTLYEPTDFALKDFSKLSYTQAFDQMFEFVRKHYAFNGYPDIQPNWDSLYAELKPRMEKAEQTKDAKAYFLVMRDFLWAFKDGHVGGGGGGYDDYFNQLFTDATGGGYGFAIRELDDGRVVVIYLTQGGPAEKAGMQVGAEVTEFNGQPIKDAIGKVTPWTLPMSSQFELRYQQARYLLRAPLDTEASVAFTNPGGQSQTITLKAVKESDSFSRTSIYFNYTTPQLPVDYRILDSGVGYVAVNSYSDDLNLTFRLFKRALDSFKSAKVPGIIIDLRFNGGGNPIGLSAFLSNQEITMPQSYSYSDTTGKFEKMGMPARLLPNVEQYSFDKMAVLVGPGCGSACEDEAFTFSKVPGLMVVGMFPSNGSMADVGDGQIAMPENFSMQIPTQRFLLPDGSLYLQGKGVQPTVKVPITEATVESTDDVVLNAAVDAVLGKSSASAASTQPVPTATGAPKIASKADATSAASAGVSFLEDKAAEKYKASDFANPGKLTYTVSLSASDQVLWSYAWCTTTADVLAENLKNIKLKFTLDGQDIPISDMVTSDVAAGGQQCHEVYTALSEWPTGQHHIITTATFTNKINDGTADYPAGDYVLDYTVNVK